MLGEFAADGAPRFSCSERRSAGMMCAGTEWEGLLADEHQARVTYWQTDEREALLDGYRRTGEQRQAAEVMLAVDEGRQVGDPVEIGLH